jgi:quercetin dioxygenase-like cupin family protein
VYVDSIVDGALIGGAAKLSSAQVTFTPGARTHWHTHPVGQTLYVVSGLGMVQLEGGPVQTIRPGDVVVIAPGENHWHGADAGHTMVHVAMQESDGSGTVVWGRAVTDAEYNG